MIKFTTKSYSDIVYIDDVAEKLFRFMGHSGTVPGAILPQDIPQYLENLEHELGKLKDFVEQSQHDNPDADDNEPAKSLRKRARPLIELMTSALDSNQPVSWK